ncbi:glutamine synthetase-like [Babylonia areolata]|uniref:glutamine synthetase-like n=1 Tax=Babylonia areolata TaxID=304850 RepID=UPI003FD1E426
MAESSFFQEQEKYEYLQFVIPDVNSIPRGKLVTGKFKETVAKDGFEIGNGVCLGGPNFELSFSMFEVLGKHIPNEVMRPCLDTLTPWPWVGKEGRRVGSVLCDLVMHDGTPDLTSPRQLMKAQLDALWEQHGLVFKSGFEYEFDVFEMDTLEPLAGNNSFSFDLRVWDRHHELFCDLTDTLKAMGVQVSMLTPEFGAGQWEITTEPQEGVRGGDVAFYMKNAVKGFLQTRGYLATFMSKPNAGQTPSGLHLNHSLWSKNGDKLESVLMDRTDPDLLSSTARHWLAGILTHSPALTALCCPTLNCYRRMFQFCAPGKINWGLDDRNALIRVHTARDNVFFENRLPSGACSPYLAIAATVAAGLDGINRQLPCPKPMDTDQKVELPRTLAEALDALEKDEHLRCLLGDRFVECYIKSKREYEVSRFDKDVLNTEEKQMQFERKMYMKSL